MFQLQRYALENHLLDPINVFNLVKQKRSWIQNKAFAIEFNEFVEADETPDDQKVVDFVCQALRKKLPQLLEAKQLAKKDKDSFKKRFIEPLKLGEKQEEDETKLVKYTCPNVELNYPVWFLHLQGHWLEDLYADTFESFQNLRINNLLSGKISMRLAISKDLEELIVELAERKKEN